MFIHLVFQAFKTTIKNLKSGIPNLNILSKVNKEIVIYISNSSFCFKKETYPSSSLLFCKNYNKIDLILLFI